ncbi:helix-turn-helix domain-containing protein [Clostridium cagae]|uniref:helix-turn-helix domain-containing protein n=1 Tax=Clostridium cagae TaxID=2080751 RepID=UPI000CF63EE2|nr:helix-turn-helix domain-containing protein [Clostridium cagae]
MDKISKDFIKFRQHIRTLKLSINKQYLLELFFEFHNHKYGYCFFKFSDILKAFNTTSKNRVSTTIKSLEENGLLIVDRDYKNNRYFIVDVNNFINVKAAKMVESKEKKVNVDSNGNVPAENQISAEEFLNIEDERIEVIKDTVNDGQASQKLITEALKNDIEIVKDACSNAKEKTNKINSKFLINAIKYAKGRTKRSSYAISEVKYTGFNNFEGRKYDYDRLENMLLGWE